MKLCGLQKMTLLDYPGKVACTVFTGGCDLRCPFCHNALLVTELDEAEEIGEEKLFSLLNKRKGILDGVAVTGGEPLLQPDIIPFLEKIKALGYAVKLDHNGTRPALLKEIIDRKLVDYVAVDVKNCREKYGITAGVPDIALEPFEKTVDLLLSGNVPYEFRTTIVREFHDVEDIGKIGQWITGAENYFLQNFVDSGNLIGENMHPVEKETLLLMKAEAEKYVKNVGIRGV
ncbi:MAG: anaerobic ribonucleoside-triphosphate reductase activating protein [Lachnospiraceae bacterium]|nr:anaerobic ribonucleoside-triphosphate reductase activating protein [Lachnospiraceae bacterium]